MNTIFVDLGETLVHFKPSYHENIANALKEMGYNIDSKRVFRAVAKVLGKHHYPSPEYGGLSALDFTELFYELNLFPKKEIIRELNKRNLLSGEYELYEDAIPFLEEVKKLGLKVVLVSNATRNIYKILDELNIKKYFDGIVASCDLNIMKPHPRIFSYAMEIAKGYGIHIGDIYEIDVLGANRAGLEGILIDRLDLYPEINKNKVRNLLEALDLIKERLKEK